MFTGIIEEIGKIINISFESGIKRLAITGKGITEDIKTGDSIAVDGACLTVVGFESGSFQVEVMKETIEKTTLGTVKTGTEVNLERAPRRSYVFPWASAVVSS